MIARTVSEAKRRPAERHAGYKTGTVSERGTRKVARFDVPARDTHRHHTVAVGNAE